MTPTQPTAAIQARPSWHIENRPGSGLFIVSHDHGTLLFRIDPKTGSIYPYDKKCKGEIEICLNDLVRLQTSTQTPAPVFGQPATTPKQVFTTQAA